MDSTPYKTINLRTIGEHYDSIKCWDARDRHFDCLDSFTDKLDNHFKCPSSYSSWKNLCDPAMRRYHMEERSRIKMNNALYNQADLDDYNRRKNSQRIEKTEFF